MVDEAMVKLAKSLMALDLGSGDWAIASEDLAAPLTREKAEDLIARLIALAELGILGDG